MPAQYVVKRGDTLSRIARTELGSASLTQRLAAFNGFADANLIRVGQVVEIPSARELKAATLPTPTPPLSKPTSLSGAAVKPARVLQTPSGYAEIVDTFGDVKANLDPDGNILDSWVQRNIGRAHLPFPLLLSWNHAQTVTSFQCHLKLVSSFESVFQTLADNGLQHKVHSYGGCFVLRQKRTSAKLSTHSWGIAVDLNTESNALGTKGDMDPGVVAVFESFGFFWGGRFSGRKDPMHFQYCTGY